MLVWLVVCRRAKKVWLSRHGTFSPTFFAPQAGPLPLPSATEKAGSIPQGKEKYGCSVKKSLPNREAFLLVWFVVCGDTKKTPTRMRRYILSTF